MSDLIERVYLIRKFEYDGPPAVSEMGKGYDLGIAAALRVVKNAPAVNRWISCEERLPEVYEKVLTYSDDGIIHDNFRLNLRDGSVGWSQGWGITHWKPRPDPPEKE